MKIEKSLIVIPKDENIPVYYKKSNENHIYLIRDCMEKLGFLERDFAKSGCVEIQTSEDPEITLAIVYLPSSLSQSQYDYLLQMRDFFQKFKYFEAGIYSGEMISIIFDRDFPNEKKVDCFYEMIEDYVERRSLS